MATYPIKMMIDESGQPFVPLTSLDAVIGEKNLQYIIDATETSAGHFNIIIKDVTLDKLKNTVVVVRWPKISSTVKPSYLQLNEEEEIILYNGSGTEYLDLEEASNTVNILAYDGEKWILTSGAGSGSGSGHVITDAVDRTLPQQKILKFIGFNIENDATNRATKIINPEPINNLTTNESGLGALDASQGYILAGRSIPTGGFAGQVLAKKNGSDYQVEWINTAGDNAIEGDGSITKIVGLTYEEYKELESRGEIEPTTQYHITDVSSPGNGVVLASDVQLDDGNMLDDKLENMDIINEGQNTRLDIAEGNIDAMAGVINNHSNTLATLKAQDVTSSIVPYDTSKATLGAHSRLIKYGPVYAYQVSFVTASTLSANTSYTLATIPSEHRPNIANTSIQGIIRGNNDIFISFWISGGQVQIYPSVTLPSGTNLAGCFTWINL